MNNSTVGKQQSPAGPTAAWKPLFYCISETLLSLFWL